MNPLQRIEQELPEGYRPFTAPRVLKLLNGGTIMNGARKEADGLSSVSPIKNKVGSIFIPVRDIERSRAWYCRMLGFNEEECSILNGHLCPLPMEGTGVILDTMPKWGGGRGEGAPHIETPAFMLLTQDLQGSYTYMKELGAEIVTEIEHDHWFVIKDPDGNKLMICKE